VALPAQALPVYPSQSPSIGTFANRPWSWPKTLGWVPNLATWLPGDILLFDSLPGLAGKAIQAYQAANAHASARQFANLTHCAVYLGGGLIADSRFRRLVGVRRLWPETMKRATCVLRFDPKEISPDEVRDFVEEIYELEDVPYGATPWAYKNWRNGTFRHNGAPTGLVCSALIELAATKAGIPLSLARKVTGPMLPASFMAHPWLLPVQAEWQISR